MREAIIENANHNSIEENQTSDGIKWLKLNSYEDLILVQDLMGDIAKESLDDQKEDLIEDIESGITFAFWFDEDGKLTYER